MKCSWLHVITALIKIIYVKNNIASYLKSFNQIDSMKDLCKLAKILKLI